MLERLIMASLVASLAAVCVAAQTPESLPRYQADRNISGTVRVWGSDRMQALMKYWHTGFIRHHPRIRFETNLLGTGTAMAGLYTSVADIALMGRESTAKEVQAFEWVFKYKPLGVEVATGSCAVTGKSFAVAVFVHRDNP